MKGRERGRDEGDREGWRKKKREEPHPGLQLGSVTGEDASAPAPCELLMKTPRREVPWDQFFKCITIGDAGVGKSCLLLRFTDQKFRQEVDPTIGLEAESRMISIDDKLTKLQIWDTAGQETHRSCTRALYRGAAAAIVVYDITRRETFDDVGWWLKEAEEFAPPNLTIVLVGNKCDLSHKRTVSLEEGREFANKHGLIFMESSAKTNQNVEEAFLAAARTVSKKNEDGTLHPSAECAGLPLLLDEPFGRGAGLFRSNGCCS